MNYNFFSGTALFRNIGEEDLGKMQKCLRFRVRSYKKGENILRCGNAANETGLVVSGSVQIENTDLYGNKTILSAAFEGEAFAEMYACMPGQPLMVDVTAREDCEILFIDSARLMTPCEQPCSCHTVLIKNLLLICARKNFVLSNRIFDTAPRTIRGKIVSYFSRLVIFQGTNHISLPFDRQQLADYLGVDRSALSRELGMMKKEGLLEYDRSHRNIFTCKIEI